MPWWSVERAFASPRPPVDETRVAQAVLPNALSLRACHASTPGPKGNPSDFLTQCGAGGTIVTHYTALKTEDSLPRPHPERYQPSAVGHSPAPGSWICRDH
jgi:hypothetical protein